MVFLLALREEGEQQNLFRKAAGFLRHSLSKYGLIWALLLLMIIASLLSDAFLTSRNLLNVLRQVSINGVLALGMTFVIISGGIDLSVGGIVAMSCVLVAIWQKLPFPLVVVMSPLAGMVVGLANGFISAVGRMQPFIVTLGMSSVAEGIAFILTNGRPIFISSPLYAFIGNGYLWIIPMPVVIYLTAAFISYLVLSRTVFGTYVYALGGNQEAARLSGINTRKYQILTFALAGLLAGVAGVIMAGRITTGDPSVSAGLSLDAIAAAVIGGSRLGGGFGTIGGSVIGAFIIGILNNVFNLLNINPYYQMVAKGSIIIGAVYIGLRRK